MGLHHRQRVGQGQPFARKMRPRRSRRAAIGRGEVVFCLLLAGMMFCVLLPWINQRRDQSRQIRCEDRQTQLGRALQVYALFQERFPGWVNPRPDDAQKLGPRSWAVEVLPWVGRRITDEELTDRLQYDHDRRGPRHDDHATFVASGSIADLGSRQFVPEFICPEDPRAARRYGPLLGFVVNGGKPDEPPPADPPDLLKNGVFLDAIRDTTQISSPAYVEDHDGAAFTLLLSENVDAGLWTDLEEARLTFLWSADDAPPEQQILGINVRLGQGDQSIPFARPAGRHDKGVNAVFVDGRSQFIRADIDRGLWRGMMTSEEGRKNAE